MERSKESGRDYLADLFSVSIKSSPLAVRLHVVYLLF